MSQMPEVVDRGGLNTFPPTGPQKTKRKMITIDLKDFFIIVFLATESMPRPGFVAEVTRPCQTLAKFVFCLKMKTQDMMSEIHINEMRTQ